MSIANTDNLRWLNIVNTPCRVVGVALVKRGFVAQLHRHAESETYYILWGIGHMMIGAERRVVAAPERVVIRGNVPHALTPLSSYVLLVYTFRRGPFENIEYHFIDRFIDARL